MGLKKIFFSFIFAMVFMEGFVFSVPKVEAKNNADVYSYQIVEQSPYPDKLKPNETVQVSLNIKNTGSATWYKSGTNNIVRLGTGSSYGLAYQQKDYDSEFSNNDWISPNRPATFSQDLVAPEGMATFYFSIKAPSSNAFYKAYFTPVADGHSWMNDMGIYWEIEVNEDATSINNLPIQPNFTNISDSFAPSVVKIISQRSDSRNTLSQGSGTLFYNSNNDINKPSIYILTNEHVVRSEWPSNSKSIIQLFPDHRYPDKYLIFKSQGYTKNENGIDIAMIKPETVNPDSFDDIDFVLLASSYGINIYQNNIGSFEDLLQYSKSDDLLKSKTLKENSKIITIGYPSFGGKNITISEGSPLGFYPYQGTEYLKTNARVGPGLSGGLAINEWGDILGIPSYIIRGPSENDNIGLILQFSELPSLYF